MGLVKPRVVKSADYWAQGSGYTTVHSRVSSKALHMMAKLLPPIFLFHFAPMLIILSPHFFGLFATLGNFWTSPNPLMMKNLENCLDTV